jgi:hypothetical protein
MCDAGFGKSFIHEWRILGDEVIGMAKYRMQDRLFILSFHRMVRMQEEEKQQMTDFIK